MNKKVNIEIVKDEVKPSKLTKLSDKTINKYKSMLKLFLSDENLMDYNKTYINLHYKISEKNHKFISKETQRCCLSSILWYLKTYYPKKIDIINNYSLLLSHLRKSCEYDTKNSLKAKQNIISWNNIIKIREKLKKDYDKVIKNNPIIIIDNKIKNKRDLNVQEKSTLRKYLLSCIYTYFPPRRILDYAYMNYIYSINDYIKNIKHDNNYQNHNFYCAREKVFIFNYYKTRSIYGKQTFKIPPILSSIIDNYAKLMNLKYGELIFKGKNFNLLLHETFDFGINVLRHSYISECYYKYYLNNNFDYKKIENLSKYMGHSIVTNIGYFKNKTIIDNINSTQSIYIPLIKSNNLSLSQIKKCIYHIVIMTLFYFILILSKKNYDKYHLSRKRKVKPEIINNDFDLNSVMIDNYNHIINK